MQDPDFDNDLEAENEHVDERWLVSYADMMTLLFGLFVMLYAMSNPLQVGPEDAERIQSSIRENFGAKDNAHVAATPTQNIADEPSRNETGTQGNTPGERPGQVAVKEIPQDGNDPASNKKASLEIAGDGDPVLAQPNPDLEKDLELARGQAKKLSRDLNKANAAVAAAQKDADDSKAKVAEYEALLNSLKEELKQKSAGPLPGDGENKRSFISTFIQWETEKHDVDMVIVHPNGKKFSYRNRTHSGMSGNFILDSRQGPGMEVWQDAMLAPGRYQMTAVLYNDYGNRKPASVQGSILTVKGRVDLPRAELSMKQREHVYEFTVDAEGGVSLGKGSEK